MFQKRVTQTFSYPWHVSREENLDIVQSFFVTCGLPSSFRTSISTNERKLFNCV